MEGNTINFAEGDIDECTWIQFSKIKESAFIPENEKNEILKNYNTQKYHSRLCKLNKANLIFFYLGNKLFFLDKSNLSKIFKKNMKTNYDNFHYWEFDSEIKYIKIIDLKIPLPRDDISLEEKDKLYNERFIIIFLEKRIIIFDSDKFVCLLENLLKNNPKFNGNSYFKKNSLFINVNSEFNTNNFIIFEDNQSENNNDFYHFFFINYPGNLNKEINYISEIYDKNFTLNLQHFKIRKSALTSNDSVDDSKQNKINSDLLQIKEFGITANLIEHVESNLICLDINENLNFFKIQFEKDQLPKIIPAIIQNENSCLINLKKIAFQDKNPDTEIFDICLIKKIKSNCLFISGFEYPKTSEAPNKDSINTNFFIQYSYDNLNGILNDVKITFFHDTYYPDDIYDFKSKPIIEALHLNYQDEILILANSQDKQLESFAFFDEIDSLEIKLAGLEDEYKFCLPVFEDQSEENSKNAVPIGITFIDFLFDGYDKEKYIINADEVFAPYLIMVLDNYGRLFFGYIVNKHLIENPLKKDEKDFLLKGFFKVPQISEQEELPQKLKKEESHLGNVQNEVLLNSSIFKNTDKIDTIQSQKEIENLEYMNFSFGNGGNFSNYQPKLQNSMFSNENLNGKKDSENKFKDLILKDNKPKEEEYQKNLLGNVQKELKTNNQKIEINIISQNKSSKDISIQEKEEYENIISLDNKKKDNKANLININTQIKQNVPNINAKNNQKQVEEDISSGSDSENICTISTNLVNKPCEKIYSASAANEAQKILVNPKNIGFETQWYTENLEKYKQQKEKLMQLREKEQKELLDKFQKDSQDIKAETQRIITQKEIEFNKKLEELEKEKGKLIQIEVAKEKKRFENIQREKEEAIILTKELREKLFNESKKNIACNLEVYLEIIRNKVDNFIEEAQNIKGIQNELKENEKIYQEIEKEIENYNLKKAEVENKISSFYDIDYNSNIEYLSQRMNNLVEIILKDNKKLSSEEIDEFIYNNQLKLSAENKKKVLKIKQNYEKMIIKFQAKLDKFKKQAEESKKLIDKFSDNKNINDILELNNKYEGSFDKFVKKHPQEPTSNFRATDNINNISREENIPENHVFKNFNFNRNKYSLKNYENEKDKFAINNKQDIKINKYDEITHTKLFEEIMREYESEFENLKNQFENIKKEIESLPRLNNQVPNSVVREIPVNAGFDFDKSVYSESAIKNLYKSYKENNINCPQDPFSNIELYNELKNHLGKVLQNHIPSVEYIDDSGDDFDEIFNKDKQSETTSEENYDPRINSFEFREKKKFEYANIFNTRELNGVYQKYKDECNQAKIIETAQAKAKKDFEEKNKNLISYAKNIKIENKENKEIPISQNKISDKSNTFSKNESSKNINNSSKFSSESDNNNNSSIVSGKDIESNNSSILKQPIPSSKQDEKNPLLPNITTLNSERSKDGNQNKRENSVESSKDKNLSQPKENFFSFKHPEEPKGLFTNVTQQSTSSFNNPFNLNKAQKEEDKKKENHNQIFSNVNANNSGIFGNTERRNELTISNNIFPKQIDNENNKTKETASKSFPSGIELNKNLVSSNIIQQKPDEKKEAKDVKQEKDAFSNLIPNLNIDTNPKPLEKQKEVKNIIEQSQVNQLKNQPVEPPKNLFTNITSATQISGINPFNFGSESAKQNTENEIKKEDLRKDVKNQEDKNSLPAENANSLPKLLNQNLSFDKQASENQENKPVDENISKPLTNNNAVNNIPLIINQASSFANKSAKSDSNSSNLLINNGGNTSISTSLNQDGKKEENKTSILGSQNNLTQANYGNTFKPFVNNQNNNLPVFGKPAQVQEANKSITSVSPSISNQSNIFNNASNSGFAGFGQTSTLNSNQQPINNTFAANIGQNLESNAIPKFGFGQSSSLGAPIANPQSTTMNIGFGKNLGNSGGFNAQGGFASLSSNNAGGFLAQSAVGNIPFGQNQTSNFNAGFNQLNNNNNQMNTGFSSGFNMNMSNTNNSFAGGINSQNNQNNSNMFFNQQQQQPQNNINRQGPGPIKNDYDF